MIKFECELEKLLRRHSIAEKIVIKHVLTQLTKVEHIIQKSKRKSKKKHIDTYNTYKQLQRNLNDVTDNITASKNSNRRNPIKRIEYWDSKKSLSDFYKENKKSIKIGKKIVDKYLQS